MPDYEAIQIQYSGGNNAIHTATVRIKKPDGSQATDTSVSASGPVDAVIKAIQRALGIYVKLVGFSISATDPGSEAVGEVALLIQDDDGVCHTGSGRSTDIIVASGEAFVDALNKKYTFEAVVVRYTV